MSRPTTTATPEPRRRGSSLHAAPAQPPVVVRPAPPVRVPPAPLARCVPPSAPAPVKPVRRRPRRSWSKLAWLAIIVLSLLLSIGGTFTFLLLTGQDEVIAWIVVGCVLVVVFGTPLLCVIGLVAFYIWAQSRVGRSHTVPARSTSIPDVCREHPVVWGEVVFDD